MSMALGIESEAALPGAACVGPRGADATGGQTGGPNGAVESWQDLLASIGMSSALSTEAPNAPCASGFPAGGMLAKDEAGLQNEAAHPASGDAGDGNAKVSKPAANPLRGVGSAAEAEIASKTALGFYEATQSAAEAKAKTGHGNARVSSQKKVQIAARTTDGPAVPPLAPVAVGSSVPVAGPATIPGVVQAQKGPGSKPSGSARIPILPAQAEAWFGLGGADAKLAALEPDRIQEKSHSRETLPAEVAQVESVKAAPIAASQLKQADPAEPGAQTPAGGITPEVAVEVSSATVQSVRPGLTYDAQGIAEAVPPHRTAKGAEGLTGAVKPSPAPSVGAVAGAATDREKHVETGRTENLPVESSALARDLSGGSGTIAARPAAMSSASPESSGRETFAALDAGTRIGAPGWIHAAPQHAEAGFQDPALGWVGVRADVTGGGIHAALVPGSTDAAQALAGHMAGLTAHLASQHMEVHSVTVAAPGAERNGWSADSGTQQGAYGGTDGHRNQNQSASAEPVDMSGIAARGVRPSTAPNGETLNSTNARRGGVYISVLA
jgi:hypothetical protein